MHLHPGEPVHEEDRPADELDDVDDRDELRRRYYGLLQELRVLLPGVQILVAFLLTVPFANGFTRLHAGGRDLYGVSLLSGVAAIIAFVTPTAFHRVGSRQSRSERLEWGIRMLRVGLAFLGTSLLAALAVVVLFVFGGGMAIVVAVAAAAALLGCWVVLPLTVGERRTHGGTRRT